jgi:hypothetical protein
LAKDVTPTTIIFHLGTNDIFRSTLGEIRARIESNLKSVRILLPQTRIIWSDILPRQAYKGETKTGAGKRCTKDLNKKAHEVCDELGNCHYIKSAHVFNPDDDILFYKDKTHLSDFGNVVFRTHLANALGFFNRFPNIKGYPPQQQQ